MRGIRVDWKPLVEWAVAIIVWGFVCSLFLYGLGV